MQQQEQSQQPEYDPFEALRDSVLGAMVEDGSYGKIKAAVLARLLKIAAGERQASGAAPLAPLMSSQEKEKIMPFLSVVADWMEAHGLRSALDTLMLEAFPGEESPRETLKTYRTPAIATANLDEILRLAGRD